MSDLGAIMDALILEVRSAIPTIPAAAAGAERGLRSADVLLPHELPHLFVHSPTEEIELLDFQQERRTATIVLSIVSSGQTQETVAAWLDGVRDEIAGNRTLGGLVDYSLVTRREIAESAVSAMREGVLEVTTTRIA